MTARRTYWIAFFALGWLLAIGFTFHNALSVSLKSGYSRIEAGLARASQKLSDYEGRALTVARGGSRADELAPMREQLTAAALRQPKTLLFGAYDGGFPTSFAGLEDLEHQLAYRFPIVSFYQAWGDRPDQREFPTRMVETIDRLGSVPMITWEPWVKDFDPAIRTNLPPLEQREYASLASIARGDYDFYVVPWATAAAKFGKPLFFRFAHEMNDPYRYPWGPQNGDRPDDFIAAWRHVHAIFQKMNASNVLWVWSPHISMPWFEYYYPGAEYVDWVATGVLNYGTVAPWSRWWTFDQIFGKAYPALDKLGKPIMISEFGTLSAGGDEREWLESALSSISARYPRIRSIVLFNQEHDETLSTAPLNWSVTDDALSLALLRERLHARTGGSVR